MFAGGQHLPDSGSRPPGRDAAELAGRSLHETVPAEHVDQLAAHCLRALIGHEADADAVTAVGRVWQHRIRPVHDSEGQVVAALVVTEDVTAARALITELVAVAAERRHAQHVAADSRLGGRQRRADNDEAEQL